MTKVTLMRCLPLLVALVATTAATPVMADSVAPLAADTTRRDGPALRVGSELVAHRDVKLRDATLAKGSRVKVVHVARKGGAPVALDLELKDGHVLRGVAYRVVRDAFRPARR
jgi:hypothetical protein